MNNQVLLIIIAVVIVLLLILTLIIVKTQRNKIKPTYALEFEVEKLVEALGGKENIKNVDAIGSRLKVSLADNSKVNHEKVKALGATGIIEKSDSINFIFGQASTSIKELLNKEIK